MYWPRRCRKLDAQTSWRIKRRREINPFIPYEIFYLRSLDGSFFKYKGCQVTFLLTQYFLEIPVVNAKQCRPWSDATFAASDLGLHCLPMSILWDARHKWENEINKKSKRYMYIYDKETLY